MHDASDKPRTPASPFILIELLVVVSIIAVLAAMLLPALSQARKKARRITCMAQQKQIGLAITMYADDYDGFVPPNAVDGVGHTSLIQRQIVTWKDMRSGHGITGDLSYFDGDHGGLTVTWPDYVAGREIFYCPSGRGEPIRNGVPPARYIEDDKYWLPDATNTGRIGFAYTAGVKVAGDYSISSAANQAVYRDGGGVYRPMLERKLDEIHKAPSVGSYQNMPRPHLYIMLMDVSRNREPAKKHFAHDSGIGCAGMNLLFSDGHVEWFPMLGAWWSRYQGQYYSWAGDVFIGSEGFVTGWRY